MKKIILILMLSTNLFFLSTIVYAQNSLKYEMVSWGKNDKSTNIGIVDGSFLNQQFFTINYQSFSKAFQFLFDLIIGVSIAAAVIIFMYGAFNGIISSTSGKEQKEAKDQMTNAIIGLMIVLSTWLIINTINPDLLRLPLFNGLDQIGSGNNSTTQPQAAAAADGF